MKRAIAIAVVLLLVSCTALAKESSPKHKTKFYNFDDLLINGKVAKPKVMWIDRRQKAKFDRLLRLKRDFLPRLLSTKQDPSLD